MSSHPDADNRQYFPSVLGVTHEEVVVIISDYMRNKEIEREMFKNKIKDIASIVRTLTYGEMHELCDAIWAMRPGDSPDRMIEHDSLPQTLHSWATSEGMRPSTD